MINCSTKMAGQTAPRRSRTSNIISAQLDERLKQWPPGTSRKVKKLVTEIIEFADQDALDMMRSREVEQEVLDLLDEAATG